MSLLAPASGVLGAPGVFTSPAAPVREITGVRRDIAAFLGVAPRGPARMRRTALEPDVTVAEWLSGTQVRRTVPIPVTSFDEYLYHFGGFEGPGRLPYNVSAFFAGGGEHAWIARIVHDYGGPDDLGGVAHGHLDGLQTTSGTSIGLLARSEGRWGNGLRSRLSFSTRVLSPQLASLTEIVVGEHEWVPAGTLLRLELPGDVIEFRYVDDSSLRPRPDDPHDERVLSLSLALGSAPNRVEVVTANFETRDVDGLIDRREFIEDIGLRADHPRWFARVLITESNFVWPDESWVADGLAVDDPQLGAVELAGTDVSGVATEHMTGGENRWSEIVPEDFWDDRWVPGNEGPGDGVQAFAENREIGLVLAPDLYEPVPLVPVDDVGDPPSLCGPDFAVEIDEPAIVEPPTAPLGLVGLSLNPLLAADLARIVHNQRQLADWVEFTREATLLLDVPLGLPHRTVIEWRNNFDSPHVAAFHPWVDTSTPDDQRDSLVRINPSAYAAAIIAKRELRLGVQFGPANEIAIGALRVDHQVAPRRHDELHRAGVNVFATDRAGIRLTGARTLSRQSQVRQLSVARLMTVLRLSLEREMQWVVFEPNNRELWAEVRRMVHSFLTRLYAVGAFTGATTKQAFFVTCDRTTMTQHDLDNGRIICLVGVAPVEPIEYIVIELALESTSTVRAEVTG